MPPSMLPTDVVWGWKGSGVDLYRSFYLGKKVAYVYRGHKEIRGTKIRVIWGRVTRPHGEYSPDNSLDTGERRANG